MICGESIVSVFLLMTEVLVVTTGGAVRFYCLESKTIIDMLKDNIV